MVRTTMLAMAASAGLAGSVLAAEPMVTGLAIYEIGVDPSKGSGIAAITGTMRAKIEHVCNAYVTEAALDAEISGPDGRRVPLKVVSRHRETVDDLEFEISTSLANMAVDAARGTAIRDTDGLIVELDEPNAGTLVLPERALFPMGMLEAAIAAAKAGETFVQFRTFDGTGGGSEVWTVSVLITPADAVADEEETMFVEGLGFGDMAHWRMALSYFPPGAGGEQTPAFSTSMVVYENGFAQAAVYDLGQFAMTLELTEFRPIPPTPCP